jgi:hypothetical protein
VTREGASVYYSLRRKTVLQVIDLPDKFMAEELTGHTKPQKAAGKLVTAQR